ncbi:MAG: PEP-CTERM sorting domain-containing protein [Gemmatimonadota bacterium]
MTDYPVDIQSDGESATPEPATMVLLASGFVAIGIAARRRRRA